MGITTATVHVMMGPDHLAAVTPLVFDTQKKHWLIGLLWGIGHLIGMLFIGILFYQFKDALPLKNIANYSEKTVGIILIGLGIWSFYRIKNKQYFHKHPHFHNKKQKDSIFHIHTHTHHNTTHKHTHKQPLHQNKYTAILIGIIHGFAGIAHFVLLLPVLGFNTNYESLQYIVGFAFGILFSMILYTLLLGKFQKKQQNKTSKSLTHNLQFWSGVLAIVIGIYWIFTT